eukprot:PhF_6_TR10156/c0_g1_i1/m.15768
MIVKITGIDNSEHFANLPGTMSLCDALQDHLSKCGLKKAQSEAVFYYGYAKNKPMFRLFTEKSVGEQLTNGMSILLSLSPRKLDDQVSTRDPKAKPVEPAKPSDDNVLEL